MQVEPLYTAGNLNPAYHLHFDWTGWPTAGTRLPVPLPWRRPELEQAWEADGLRCLEGCASAEKIQIAFSVMPQVCPVLLCARAKGRLQDALRKAGMPVRFSRKLSMRSVGENRRKDVERYIETQIGKERFADSRFAQGLEELIHVDPRVDLSVPFETSSGRYWYNLHLVLVTEERCRIPGLERLRRIRDQSLRIAEKKGYGVSRLAVLPDHLHIALRGNIEHSPEQIALAFQNNLAYLLWQTRVWRPTYYAGSFGEYDMDAIRKGCR